MKKLLAVCAAILACTAFADKIVMKDGSVLMGKVEQIFEGKVDFTTGFAGKVSLAQGDIASIETDDSFNFADQNNNKKIGALKIAEDGSQLLSIDGGSAAYNQNDISAMWALGSRDLTLPLPRTWSGEIYADMTGKTGNTRKFNGGTGVRATLAGPDDKFLAYATANYERENHVTSTKQYIGGLDFERQIASTNSNWYARAEFEQKKTNMLKFREQYSFGYGRYLIKKPGMDLRVRAGFMYTKKKYTDDMGQDSNYGLDLGLHFEKKIQDWSQLISDITYAPAFDDIKVYRLVHESSLDIPIIRQLPLSLRIGIKNEYESPTPGDSKHLDTTYFAKIVYRW